MARTQKCISYCANECIFGQIQQVEQLAAAQVGYITRDTKFCPAGAAALTQMLALDLGLDQDDMLK